jgi:hypothetical protein
MGDEPRQRRSYFGIAPVHAARLTVTAADGCERELRVTPWNGAFVVASPGTHSTLTGYDECVVHGVVVSLISGGGR